MSGKVVVLTGGVGGAKLVLGLTLVVPSEDISAIVNTGDDFRHFGLSISPDIDTLLYTLSAQANEAQGWGRRDESWNCMATLRSLGAEDWFALGDHDLALHLVRSDALVRGTPLSAITSDIARCWQVRSAILPMSDAPVGTIISTDEGELSFQRYFVERRCTPRVRSIRFEGAEQARPGPGVLEAIGDSSNLAILIAPSNPYLSIDPILSLPGMIDALAGAPAPVVAVTPVIAGAAVKGPTAKLFREFGLEVSPRAVARHYEPIIDAMLVDERDRLAPPDIAHEFTDTLMNSLDDRLRVARAALELADRVRSR